jgi:hypothetical protein
VHETVVAGTEVRTDLVLAGFRLRVMAGCARLLEAVVAVMVPPCEAEPSQVREPHWMLQVEEGAARPGSDALFKDRPVLALPHGGPRLAIADVADGVVRLLGRYRPDAAVSVIEVDAARRRTRVVVPSGDGVGLRWADWLARVFFASRMMAAGWQMLHASAVAVDGAAVVFLADQRGGKSTLAHRACAELGAEFLADDLVLVGRDRTVVGWPTRIALSAELVGAQASVGVDHRTVVAGLPRQRVVLSPAQHRTALKVAYSPPAPLGALVSVEPSLLDERCAAWAIELDEGALDQAVTRAVDVPAQRLYVSDVLALMGGPRPAGRADDELAIRGLLSDIPAAMLRVGDMASLSQAPVWEALAPVVPLLAGR